MSDLFTLVCQGTVSVLADGSPTCSGMWVLTRMPEPFDISMLDPLELSKAFALGFLFCAGPIAAGLGLKALLNFIRTA